MIPKGAEVLDIMPARLWGRAESVRTLFRTLAQAIAPIMFGLVADLVAGITPHQTPIGTKPKGSISTGTANGLEATFAVEKPGDRRRCGLSRHDASVDQ